MPDHSTPVDEDLSPPVAAGRARSPDEAGEAGKDRNDPGTGWISPLRIGIAAVLLVAAVVAWQLTGDSSPPFRTSVVGAGTVVATLTSVGAITPVDQANLNFTVSGTVSAVAVSVGQTVTAGQALASLDVADLGATVVSAQATLAAAAATLASAEASQTTTTSTSSASASVSTGSSTTTTAPGSRSGQSPQSDQPIAQLQGTLVSDQRQEDADSAQAAASLRQASTLCEAPVPATATIPAPATATAAGPARSPGLPTTSPAPGGTGAPTTCTEALSLASSAQAKVAADIKQVGQDESALTSALESSPGGTGRSPATPATSATAPTASPVTLAGSPTGGTEADTSAQATGSGGATTKPATSQKLAVDQASIDTAQANLTDAQQALGGADLVSTIAGTVASVSIAPGDSVTAGSTADAAQIVVIGTGSSYNVTTNVAVADIGKVAVGQEVRVTPDSTDTVIGGRVAAIAVVPTTGSTSTTYPVTVSLTSSDLSRLSGADADVAIIVKKSVNVTTVPSSAVQTLGTVHLVAVVDKGTTKEVRVTLGTVGPVLTQVTSGVSVGQVVSLADMNDPLPASSSTTSRTGFGGGGLGSPGFAASGFGGGGAGIGGRFGG